MSENIQRIETYVRRTMADVANPDLRIGHDFKHVDRVRRNALTIIDQINLQISLVDELHTPTARRIAEPRVAFMRAFVIQLEAEVMKQRVSES